MFELYKFLFQSTYSFINGKIFFSCRLHRNAHNYYIYIYRKISWKSHLNCENGYNTPRRWSCIEKSINSASRRLRLFMKKEEKKIENQSQRPSWKKSCKSNGWNNLFRTIGITMLFTLLYFGQLDYKCTDRNVNHVVHRFVKLFWNVWIFEYWALWIFYELPATEFDYANDVTPAIQTVDMNVLYTHINLHRERDIFK